MKKIILYAATSLDGFIARKNGSVDWLDKYNHKTEDYGYVEFLDSVKTIILGNTTFQEFKAPYKNKRCFVFSREKTGQENNIIYVNDAPEEFIKKLDDNQDIIWLVGGAKITKSFLKCNLINEFIITVIPAILGEGISLFLSGCGNHNLKLINSKSYDSGVVQLHYKV